MSAIQSLLNDDHAATAVEYAVMLAVILLVCIAAITAFGTATGDWWSNNATEIDNAF